MELSTSKQETIFEVVELKRYKVSFEEELDEFCQKYNKDFEIINKEKYESFNTYTVVYKEIPIEIINSSGDDFILNYLYFIFKLGLTYGSAIQLFQEDQVSESYIHNFDFVKYLSKKDEYFWIMVYSEDCNPVVDSYNDKFKTNFKLLRQETYDGTEFSFLTFKNISYSEIFQLGQFFGFKMQFQNNKDEFWIQYKNKILSKKKTTNYIKIIKNFFR